MSTAAAISLADLRPVDLFDDLDDEQLAEWAAVAQRIRYEPGELLAEQNVEVTGLTCLLEGEAQTVMVNQGRTEPVGRQVGPTWIGAISVLTRGPLPVRMEATTVCDVALIPAEDFRRLVLAQAPVHERVMKQMQPVLSRLAGAEQNRERLESLGTMAAGLAHELNNPAAAVKRAASDLADALEVIGATLGEFVEAGIERTGAERLVALQREALACAEEHEALDSLDAADAEDAMLERLEDLGVDEPWRLAEPLAAAGIDDAWLKQVSEFAGPATGAALRWVAASLTARGLAVDLLDSASRMGDLVKAIKAYAYLDRGALVQVDVHEGVKTTLVMLGHKLKHTSIEVVKDFDRDLPQLTVRGSELNQVWTNLIDNAIDAMGETGTLTITTRRDGPCVRVDIADSGPGIPSEAQPHVLDPFFTTKPVGQGTGLGLDTARQIIEEHHAGTLGFDTGADGTTFHVWLPIEGTAR
ncbi:MAG TPA: ATP-binding protein [Solirubrobacteraceae bacterium]|nr:ATP-binding protein [Solirubrobacteraceae bacterium]